MKKSNKNTPAVPHLVPQANNAGVFSSNKSNQLNSMNKNQHCEGGYQVAASAGSLIQKGFARLTMLTLIICASLFGTLPTFAQSVSFEEAQQATINFYNQVLIPDAKEKAQITDYRVEKSGNDTLLFTFQVNRSGFVILSADKSAIPVLAYNTSGGENLYYRPENVKWIIEKYNEEISLLKKSGNLDTKMTNRWQELISGNVNGAGYKTSSLVGPILSSSYDQNCPYGKLCPGSGCNFTTGAYPGCVAIAMAQIMRYHSWPTSGNGSVTYTPPGYTTQSVNFAANSYNYANMPSSVNIASNLTFQNEIAKLIYHCGVAVYMNYGTNGSTSTGNNAFNAFVNNFKYQANYYNSLSYSISTWQNMLIGQLNSMRPIFYEGTNGTPAGHAWVIDGYDSGNQSYFHMNLGGTIGNFYLNSISYSGTNLNFNQRAIFLAPLKPDLLIMSFNVPATITPGVSTSISAVIKNNGSAPASATTTNFHRSSDAYYNTGDPWLASVSTPSLAPGASTTVYANITLPVGNTNNYLIVAADGGWVLPEISEANNTFSKYFTNGSSAGCGVPAGIGVNNITSSSANVYWSAISGANNYQLQYRPSNSGTWITVNAYSTSYNLSGLAANTLYYYQIRTYCTNSTYSNYSSTYSFTTSSSGGSCQQPYSLYSTNIMANQATLGFTAPGATSFIYWIGPYNGTVTSYPGYTWNPVTFTGLLPSTTYQFRVASVCGAATSLVSSTIYFTTPAFRTGNSSNSDLTEITPLKTELNISPNPVNPGGTIKFGNNYLPQVVSLCAIDGKIISSKILSENSFVVPENLSKGIYFLKSSFNGNIITTKIVVQ